MKTRKKSRKYEKVDGIKLTELKNSPFVVALVSWEAKLSVRLTVMCGATFVYMRQFIDETRGTDAKSVLRIRQ